MKSLFVDILTNLISDGVWIAILWCFKDTKKDDSK